MPDPAPAPHTEDGSPEGAPGVAVERSPGDGPVVVTLQGEHDLSTRAQVEDALAGVPGDVLVDLSACPFIDSTVIVVLIGRAQELARAGHRLELVAPPQNRSMARIVEVAGLRAIVRVHDVAPPRRAS